MRELEAALSILQSEWDNKVLYSALILCEAAKTKLLGAMYERHSASICTQPQAKVLIDVKPAQRPAQIVAAPTATAQETPCAEETLPAVQPVLFGVLPFLSVVDQCLMLQVCSFCHERASVLICRQFKKAFPAYNQPHSELKHWSPPILLAGSRGYYLHLFRSAAVEQNLKQAESEEKAFTEEEADNIRLYKLRRARLFQLSTNLLSFRLMGVEAGSGDGFVTIAYDLETNAGNVDATESEL
jgi:hypothetical protein